MLRHMTAADIGPLSLLAPEYAPRHVVAGHGHLWQWVGDGEELISLSVAVRETRLGTATGVKHHLAWEVKELRKTMDERVEAPRETDVMVMVEGASGSAAADVDGPMHGYEVHNRVIVTTDGEHLHVTRVVVRDNDAGRELSEMVTSTLRVRPWSMPA
jgi:hypothetical protein